MKVLNKAQIPPKKDNKKFLLTIQKTRSIIKNNKLTKGVPAMQKNISLAYLHTYFVNPVHVMLQGFIADGKNGVVRISRYDKE